MCDTFHPLKLSKFAKDLDDGKYACSWYEHAQDGAADEAAVDGDATGGLDLALLALAASGRRSRPPRWSASASAATIARV